MTDYTNVKKYFELLLKRERTSDHMYEAIGDMLDKIWYNFTPDELGLANELSEMAQGNTTETRMNDILQTIKEETAMNDKTYANVFENKEDYLKLRDFWKAFHAEGKHKPVKVEYRTSKPFNSGYADGEMAFHMESPLTFYNHLTYLAAVGRDLGKATDKMWFSTFMTLRHNLEWFLKQPTHLNKYYFELFGDAIDEKYRLVIANRILDHLNARYEDAKTNGWKH